MRDSFKADLRSITSGEFAEETPFKVKDLNGDILLDGADFDPPWLLIFDSDWVEIQPDGTGVAMHTPRAFVHLEDINGNLYEPLSDQNMLEINGKDYPIADVRDPENGLAAVILREAI